MIKGFPHAIGKLHLRSCFTDVSVMLHPHAATDATNRRYMRDEAQAGQKAVTRSILVLQRFHGLGCGQTWGGTKKQPRGVPIMGDPKADSLY